MNQNALQATLTPLLGQQLLRMAEPAGELVIDVAPENLLPVLQTLRDSASTRFAMLMDISGVDYPDRPARFDVVYSLLSLVHNQRLRLKLQVEEGALVPSVVSLYPCANWYEREVYDLYGIPFHGHPDLRRILTDYNFIGHPMRKDFPLTGYSEVRYDDEQKRVVYEPVSLTQDYRNFDALSPWEGMTSVQLPGDEKAVKPKRVG